MIAAVHSKLRRAVLLLLLFYFYSVTTATAVANPNVSLVALYNYSSLAVPDQYCCVG